MRRPGTPLSQELLTEEARFILRTLLRDDLFGNRVRLTEAERVIDGSISLNFADYCGFLNKYGYVRVDQLTNMIEVTEGGAQVAQTGDDPEFGIRIQRHFARELGTQMVRNPVRSGPPAPPAASVESSAPQTGTVRPARGPGGTLDGGGSQGVLEEILDRRYRRGAAIGGGPIGTVYEAEHIAIGRPVAIKEARAIFQFISYLKRDEIVRRLRGAVQKHALLIHPGIIQFLDQNHEREFPYFVMEYAPGGNLRRRMASAAEGRMPLPFALRTLTQICYALKYAHAQGVLHLGLKPENVLFDQTGNVKLTDFGFSRVMERDEEGVEKPVFVSSGAVGYMAPERIQPESDTRQVRPAADLYALGIMFYEMLTGKLPGRRSPLPSKARKDVPEAFDDVFDRMTRDELGERYATVDQVLAGVYKAFPASEVFAEGTILLWASDPGPLPASDVELAPEPESERLEPGLVIAPMSAAAKARHDPDELKTGEIELHEIKPAPPPVRSAPPAPPSPPSPPGPRTGGTAAAPLRPSAPPRPNKPGDN